MLDSSLCRRFSSLQWSRSKCENKIWYRLSNICKRVTARWGACGIHINRNTTTQMPKWYHITIYNILWNMSKYSLHLYKSGILRLVHSHLVVVHLRFDEDFWMSSNRVQWKHIRYLAGLSPGLFWTNLCGWTLVGELRREILRMSAPVKSKIPCIIWS